MAEQIGNWLMNTVGCNITCTLETIGEVCYDGKLFGEILVAYNICDAKYIQQIQGTGSSQAALSNLKKLCVWFKLLGISITDVLLQKIANKDGCSSFNLLYDLYIRLENSDNTYFIDSKKMNRILSQPTDKFKVIPALGNEENLDLMDEKQYLYDILVSMESLFKSSESPNLKTFLIEGMKKRSENMKKKILNGFNFTPTKFRFSTDEFDIQAKINEFECSMNSKDRIEGINQMFNCSPEDYIKYLRLKRRRMEADKKLKLNMEKKVMKDAWKKILAGQEIELKNILSIKLLKQSEYEKQMTLRLKRMRMNYKRFIDNKTMIIDEAEKQDMVNEFKSSFQSVKIDERECIEKLRIKELHSRIFKEKMRIKRAMLSEACMKIMEDMVDFAMLRQDYLNENGIIMPNKDILELKYLFMKGIRMLPHDDTITKIERKRNDPPIIFNEKTEELAENELHLYMYCVGPWFTEANITDHEKLTITGFIVHRLLDLKYNFNLTLGEPAVLPDFEHKMFIHRINDTTISEKLKQELSKFKIHIIDMFTVINYFLKAYKTYTTPEEIKSKSASTKPVHLKHLPHSPKTNSRKSKVKHLVSAKVVNMHNKSMQFPSIHEGLEELDSSTMLGRYTYEILQGGGLLPDAFICTLVIEYLKTLGEIKGWVFFNFPENIIQIAILEYMFTGLEVPYMSKITTNIRKLINSQMETVINQVDPKEEKRSLSDDYEEDSSNNYSIEEIIKLQNSNILPRPNLNISPPEFKSYFDQVLILQREEQAKFYKKSKSKTDENEEETITLEKFYVALGISALFSYKILDPPTMKKLLKLIVSYSPLSQNELYKLANNKDLGSFIRPPPIVNNNDVLKRTTNEKSTFDVWIKKVYSEMEDESVEEMILEEEQDMNDEVLIIYPGHQNWQYTEFPISEEMAKVLATAWESIEHFYISHLKECFSLMKTVEYRLMPYRNYIRSKSDACIKVEDDRTQLVINFQLMLNGIEDRYRSLESMKNEIHCRVFQLQCELWKMTDVKKFYCDQTMELVKSQNWMSGHLLDLLRVYKFIFQIEVDRYADTLQLIEDYYSVCLIGYVQEERLTKITLPNLSMRRNVNDRDKDTKSVKSWFKKSNANTRTLSLPFRGSKRPSKSIRSGDNTNLKLYVETNVLYYSDFESDEYPAFSLLQSFLKRMEKSVLQLKYLCEFRSKLITERFNEVTKEAAGSKDHFKPGKKKNSSKLGQLGKVDEEVLRESMDTAISKVFLEWSVAVGNEYDRTLFRIDLIKKRCKEHINEDIRMIDNTFEEFKSDIANIYHKQTLNIDSVCDLMRIAVEEETKIQPLLLLKNESFEVDSSVILYPNPPPPPPPSLNEIKIEFKFTINQLTNFYYKMVYVAPYGVVEQTFVNILEDMVCMGHETGHCYLPSLWSSLSSEQIRDIIKRLYGKKTILDWRQFIIFGLDLGYPSVENILQMRNDFRLIDINRTETVTYEQYACVVLWFQGAETWTLSEDLYYAKAKELLFKMFQIDENLINYTEFLLAFCRDIQQREGFVKALALVEGCGTIAWKQDIFRETFQVEKENEKFNVAYGIMNILLAGVYQVVDSVIITDVTKEPEIRAQPSSPVRSTTRKTLKRMRKSSIISEPSPQSKPSQNHSKYSGPCLFDKLENRESLLHIHLEKKKLPQILWKSDVYFSSVFSLLMIDIHHFALSNDEIYEPMLLEDNLRRIFKEKGNGHTIKMYDLLSDDYLKRLFRQYRCFQAISLSLVIPRIVSAP